MWALFPNPKLDGNTLDATKNVDFVNNSCI
jgi:hypothetical protein